MTAFTRPPRCSSSRCWSPPASRPRSRRCRPAGGRWPIPVVLITAQLLAACLLLLFLSVTDAIDARGHEVVPGQAARPRWLADDRVRDVRAGAAARAGLAGRHAGRVGRDGGAQPGPAAPGHRGGAAPAGLGRGRAGHGGRPAGRRLAARRTLAAARAWRSGGGPAASPPGAAGWRTRSWPTAAAAGLLDLAVTGQIGSARHGALGLLVPGLLGLAIAVIASRLLPLACRSAFSRTGTRGSVGVSSRSGTSPGARAGPGPRSCWPPRSR